MINIIEDHLPWWVPFKRRVAEILNTRLICDDYRILPYDRFAVIYDVKHPDEAIDDTNEQFYEMFSSPLEANLVYRSAFGNENHNPRLVLILGPIEEFA